MSWPISCENFLHLAKQGGRSYHLQHELASLAFRQSLLALHKLEHSLLCAQLHDDVHIITILKYLLKAHYVLVRQRLVDLDLCLELRSGKVRVGTDCCCACLCVRESRVSVQEKAEGRCQPYLFFWTCSYKSELQSVTLHCTPNGQRKSQAGNVLSLPTLHGKCVCEVCILLCTSIRVFCLQRFYSFIVPMQE